MTVGLLPGVGLLPDVGLLPCMGSLMDKYGTVLRKDSLLEYLHKILLFMSKNRKHVYVLHGSVGTDN